MEKLLPVVLVILPIVVALILLISILIDLQKSKNEKVFKKKIITLLKNEDVNVEIDDIISIKEALSISDFSYKQLIKAIYLEENDNPQFIFKLRALISLIKKEEPFSNCPNETKGILIKLEDYLDKNDKGLLPPIVKNLEELSNYRLEYNKIKNRNIIAYILTIVSFAIGIIGLVLAYRSPSIQDIEQILTRNNTTINQK